MFFESLKDFSDWKILNIYIICTIIMVLAMLKILISQRSNFSIKNIVDTFVKSHSYKMVIVVRTDISMGKGKLAAQVDNRKRNKMI